MKRQFSAVFALLGALLGIGAAHAGTVGTLISVRGHVADIEHDWSRQRLYAANFSANRVEVYSVTEKRMLAPIAVDAQPSTIALSGDQRYLTVGHKDGKLLIIEIDTGQRRTIELDEPVLAVGYANSMVGVVVTTKRFLLVESTTGSVTEVAPNDSLVRDLPVRPGVFPPIIVRASTGVSGNREFVYIIAQGTDEEHFVLLRYTTATRALDTLLFSSSPEMGPRQVSVNQSGTEVMAGWALFGLDPRLILRAQYANQSGRLDAGTLAYDWRRSLVYAQAELEENANQPTPSQPAFLHVMDTDNLTIRERLKLPRFLGGRSVFTPDMGTLFAIADGGVLMFDLDGIQVAPRLHSSAESLYFQGSGPTCAGTVITQTFEVHNPNGAPVDFQVSLPQNTQGITVSPMSGTTPAVITVQVDLTSYLARKGTTVVPLTLKSKSAVNDIPDVLLNINNRDADQRGRVINLAGRLVDLVADPGRGRFYVLRQDKNLVLVFDANTMEQIAQVRTGNTPVRMTFTQDKQYLLVGNDNSGLANVIHLDTLEPTPPIELPVGLYPRTLADTAGSLWGTARLAGEPFNTCEVAPPNGNTGSQGLVFKVNFEQRNVTVPEQLDIFCNKMSEDAVLTASESGNTAVLVEPDGSVMMYEASSDMWVLGRKDFDGLKGPYMSVMDDIYLIGSNLLDHALVPNAELDSSNGEPAGATMVPGNAFMRSSVNPAGYGYLERIEVDGLSQSRFTRTIEAPIGPGSPYKQGVGLEGVTVLDLTRSLAYVPSPETLLSIGTSGLMVLPMTFDPPEVSAPVITSVTNSADGSTNIASGGLIQVNGQRLSSMSESAGNNGWPATLGESCVLVNGNAIPLGRVSPGEIRGQLPYSAVGDALLIVQSTGGRSEPFPITILSTAPAVQRDGTAGPLTGLYAVYNKKNNEILTGSNPVRPGDSLYFYATGLGRVSPDLTPGLPAPTSPLSEVVSPPAVTLGGTALEVISAVAVPGKIGVYRIDVKVPDTLSVRGWDIPLTVEGGGVSSTALVRVVGI